MRWRPRGPLRTGWPHFIREFAIGNRSVETLRKDVTPCSARLSAEVISRTSEQATGLPRRQSAGYVPGAEVGFGRPLLGAPPPRARVRSPRPASGEGLAVGAPDPRLRCVARARLRRMMRRHVSDLREPSECRQAIAITSSSLQRKLAMAVATSWTSTRAAATQRARTRGSSAAAPWTGHR